MTVRTNIDSCPYVSELDIIEDQSLMTQVPPRYREALAGAAQNLVFERGVDCIAASLHPDADPANWPQEALSRASAEYAWRLFIETGRANRSLFREIEKGY